MAYLELRAEIMAWAMDKRLEIREDKKDPYGDVSMGMVGEGD